MIEAAEVISPAADVLKQAGQIESTLKMSAQDSLVLASVVSHLAKTEPAESCFLNRNTKDFEDASVLQMLSDLGCKFFGRFDEGLRYIESRLGKGGSD
jgi:hypothetical protein